MTLAIPNYLILHSIIKILKMDISYLNGSLNIFNLVNEPIIFPLEYIIFGSFSSMDYDIIVNVPKIITKLKFHHFLQICRKLDLLLIPIISDDKPINTCLGHWTNNQLVWSQKGTVNETNNAIISTFNNHQQMFDANPITTILPRDTLNKQLKVMAASRMIIGLFTRCITNNDYIYAIMDQIISLPQLQNLDKDSKVRFLRTLFKIYDIKTSTYNTIIAAIDNKEIDCEYKKLVNLRNKLNNMNKTTVDVTIYKQLYEASKVSIEIILNIVNTNKNKFSADFSKCLNEDLFGCELSLRCVSRAILIGKYAFLRSEFLKLLDMSIIKFCNDNNDKLKKIAFQVGQTLCLLKGIEVFEKETIAIHYPQLKPFLFRESTFDFDEINKLLHEFSHKMETFIDPTFTEL
jgi:hypothetical protein